MTIITCNVCNTYYKISLTHPVRSTMRDFEYLRKRMKAFYVLKYGMNIFREVSIRNLYKKQKTERGKINYTNVTVVLLPFKIFENIVGPLRMEGRKGVSGWVSGYSGLNLWRELALTPRRKQIRPVGDLIFSTQNKKRPRGNVIIILMDTFRLHAHVSMHVCIFIYIHIWET